MEKISIIVPIYNVEKYIHECIQSLQKQTYKNVEIVLVDDGSPDNCGNICDEYAKNDKRIKVIHQKNKGLSAARNKGLEIAQGEYICFVDSDDYVSNDYCETLYNLLKNSKYDFSVGGVRRIGNSLGEKRLSQKENLINAYSNEEFLQKQLNKKSEFGVWNKLYKREIFDEMRFSPGRLHEDVIWSSELADRLENGVIETQKEIYYYRQREDGIVGNAKKKCNADFVYAGTRLIAVAQKKYPNLLNDCLRYTVEYPWLFVDRIYVEHSFRANKPLLDILQQVLCQYKKEYERLDYFNPLIKKRMKLFAFSKIVYGINAYTRLLKMYICKVFHIDPYKDDHWI